MLRHISTLRMPPTSKANRITGDLLLSPLRLLVSRRKIVECVTAVLLPVRISRLSLRNAGQKKFFEEKENCSALDGEPHRSERTAADRNAVTGVRWRTIYSIPLSMRINCCRKLAVQYPSFSALQVWWRYFYLQPGGQRWGQHVGRGGGGGGGWENGGVGGRALKNSINRLLYLDLCATNLCGFGKRFSLSFIGTFFLFFLGPVFFLVFQPRTLFLHIFRHTRYAKRTEAKT